MAGGGQSGWELVKGGYPVGLTRLGWVIIGIGLANILGTNGELSRACRVGASSDRPSIGPVNGNGHCCP